VAGIFDDIPWIETDEPYSYAGGGFPDYKWRLPDPMEAQGDYVGEFARSIYAKRDSLVNEHVNIRLGEDVSLAQVRDLARNGRLVAYSFQHSKTTVVMLDDKELITFLEPVVECEGLQITGKIQYSLPKDPTL
jgi:hypothetical protein